MRDFLQGIKMLVVVSLYFITLLFLGFSEAHKNKTAKDYSLGDRSISASVLFTTLFATFIGGSSTMGLATKVYLSGFVFVLAQCGFALQQVFTAKYVLPQLLNYPDAISIGEIFKQHYGKTGQVLAGSATSLLCLGIVAAQVGAMGYVFSSLLDISREWGAIVGCLIVIVYSAAGGIRAVIKTDYWQCLFLLIFVPLLLYFVMNHMTDNAWLTVANFERTTLGLGSVIALILAFFFGNLLFPPFIQRMLILKDWRKVQKVVYTTSILSVIYYMVIGLLGLAAFSLYQDIQPGAAMPTLILDIFPDSLRWLAVIGILSIIMSSADSSLNTGSIALVHDVLRNAGQVNIKDEKNVLQIATLISGFVTLGVALLFEDIVDIIIYSFKFWSPVMVVPLLMLLYGKTITKHQLLGCAVLGIVSSLVWDISPYHAIIPACVVGLVCNLTGFLGFLTLKRAQPLVP